MFALVVFAVHKITRGKHQGQSSFQMGFTGSDETKKRKDYIRTGGTIVELCVVTGTLRFCALSISIGFGG